VRVTVVAAAVLTVSVSSLRVNIVSEKPIPVTAIEEIKSRPTVEVR